MKRSIVVLIAAIALLISIVAALAATHSETPNDPRVNPDANACYTGGSMEGKCKLDSELWIAGWYAIRLEYGLIGRDQVPDQYKWLLPPLANPTEPVRGFPTSPSKPATGTPTPITPTATSTATPS